MKAIKQLWIALLFAPQLLGQTSPPSSIQHPSNEDIRELNQAMVSITNYCSTVADYSNSHQPRLFAETGGSNETGIWDEFSSRAEWERAGKPKPIAVAWYKEKKVIRAVFSLTNNGDGGGRYADYCYRADGHLASYGRKRTLPPSATTLTFAASLPFRESGFTCPEGKSST